MYTQSLLILPIEEKKIHNLIATYFAHIPLPPIQLTTGHENIATIYFADYKFIYTTTGDPKVACQNLEKQFLKFLISLSNALVKKYSKITKIHPSESSYYFGQTAIEEDNEFSEQTTTAILPEPEAVAPKPFHETILERKAGSFYEQVRNYCTQYLKPYPEYTLEKQNGVYICRAEFENVQFASKYFVEKSDAQEDVCKSLMAYISNKAAETDNHAEKRKREEVQMKRQKDANDFWDKKKKESKWMRRNEAGKTVILESSNKNFWEEKKKKAMDYRKHNVGNKGDDGKKLSFNELFEN